MSSSNLVPTPIVNKNGVATTVHKHASKTTTSNTPLPSPVDKKLHLNRIYRAIDGFCDTREFRNRRLNIEYAKERIKSYPARTRAYISEFCDHEIAMNMVIHMARESFSAVDVEDALYLYGNIPEKLKGAGEEYEGEWTFHEEGNLYYTVSKEMLLDVEGLRLYKLKGFSLGKASTALRNQDEHTQKQAVALAQSCWEIALEIKLSYGIEQDSDDYEQQCNRLIADKRLAQLIVDNPEKSSAICELIAQRKSFDYELVKTALESSSPALYGGAL